MNYKVCTQNNPPSSYFVTMAPKRRTVQCPGCNQYFKGRGGLLGHLRQSLDCSIPPSVVVGYLDPNQPAGISAVPLLPLDNDVSAPSSNTQLSFVSENNEKNMACDDDDDDDDYLIELKDADEIDIDNETEELEEDVDTYNGNEDEVQDQVVIGHSGVVDYSLLHQYESFIRKGYGNMAFPPTHRSEVELLSILKRAKAPLYVYNEIMQWAHFSRTSYESSFREPPHCREKVLKGLYSRYDLHGIKPKEVLLVLPESGTKAKVVVHDMKQAIYSMLSDPQLMADENLLFHGDDPTVPPPEFIEIISDVHTG
jgi:hypothetical protein